MDYKMEKKEQYERWMALSAEFRRVQAEYLATLDSALNDKMRTLNQQLRELEELDQRAFQMPVCRRSLGISNAQRSNALGSCRPQV
jgi:hypothetical protein